MELYFEAQIIQISVYYFQLIVQWRKKSLSISPFV